MDIQADIKFKHGCVMRIIEDADITAKKLAGLAGWSYQKMQAFLLFRRAGLSSYSSEDRESLMKVLKSLDPLVREEDVFSKDYAKAAKIFKPTKITKSFTDAMLYDYYENTVLLEDKTDSVDFKKDFDFILSRIDTLLSSRERDIMMRYFGLCEYEGGGPQEYHVIGDAHNITRERVRTILETSLRKIRKGVLKKTVVVYRDQLECAHGPRRLERRTFEQWCAFVSVQWPDRYPLNGADPAVLKKEYLHIYSKKVARADSIGVVTQVERGSCIRFSDFVGTIKPLKRYGSLPFRMLALGCEEDFREHRQHISATLTVSQPGIPSLRAVDFDLGS